MKPLHCSFEFQRWAILAEVIVYVDFLCKSCPNFWTLYAMILWFVIYDYQVKTANDVDPSENGFYTLGWNFEVCPAANYN